MIKRKGGWCKSPCKVRDCKLFSGIEVPYSGKKSNQIVFIGESPGQTELQEGKPFVGKAGKLLKGAIISAKMLISDCFFMNSARCTINKDKLSIKDITEILKMCRPKVEFTLKALKPKVIVVLGDIALRQIIHKSGITKARGKWLYSKEFDCYVLPMFHPAYILRNMSMLPRFRNDIKMLSEFVQNDFSLPESNEKLNYISDGINLHTLAKIIENKAIAIDTETQGLDAFSDDFLVISFSLSHKKGTAYQINLYREVPIEESDFTIQWERKLPGKNKKGVVRVGIKREDNFNGKLIFLQNLLQSKDIKKYMMSPYDILAFYSLFKREWVPLEKIQNFNIDIQAAANVLNENLYTMASLDALQKDFTEIKEDYNYKFGQDFSKEDMLYSKKANIERFNEYACYDADVTRRVGIELKKELLKSVNRKQAEYFVKFTMPTINKIMYEMTKNGIRFDLEAFPKTRTEIKNMVDRLERRVIKYIPEQVVKKHEEALRLSRKDIIRDALFSKIGYGLPIVKKNKTAPSIDAKARQKLLDMRGISSDTRKCIELYAEYMDAYTLYTRNLKKFDSYVKPDGKLHTRASVVSAVTGRMSSSDPNLMAVPKRSKLAMKVRQLLCASDGYMLLATDQSQCLVPETEIVTIDGIKTLDQILVERIPVLSMDKEANLSFQRVLNGWCTGVNDIYRMHLGNGGYVDCTINHRFRMYTGGYKKVLNINIGDRLTHVWFTKGTTKYTEFGVGCSGSYNEKRRCKKKWRAHRLVAKFLNGERKIAHHIDRDITNWTRENIKLMTRKEHSSLHSIGTNNPNYGNRKGTKKKCPICHRIFYRCPSREHEITCSKSCSNKAFPRSRERKRTGVEKKCPVCGILFYLYPYKSKQVTCSRECSLKYFPRKGRKVNRNHKVIAIEKLGKRNTFQIEVEANHNYILANGLCSKNSELRWLAHVAEDPTMINVFRTGEDIHTATARVLVGVHKWDNLSDEEKKKARRSSKAVNFGLIYGMGINGFIDYCKKEYGIVLSRLEAERWVSIFFNTYNRIQVYHRNTIAFCRKCGYVESCFGRRRRLPEINSDDNYLRSLAERQAINHRIQSPSSDTVLIAGNDFIDKKYPQEEARVVLFIHDELIFEVKRNLVNKYIKIIKDHMEHPSIEEKFGVKLKVPLAAGVKVGPNLRDLEEVV